MKTNFKDALQVTAALLITGGMASAMTPQNVALPTATHTAPLTQEVKKLEPAVAPIAAPEPSVVKWQDNPNKCTDAQYIDANAPFNCIDRPAQVATQPTAPRIPSTASFGGSCASWIAAAGISDVANANELIRRESGCNPGSVNPSSGACGVAQELPCGKSGCDRADGACQVKWMNGYVLGRYGSWAAAVSFHNSHNYY